MTTFCPETLAWVYRRPSRAARWPISRVAVARASALARGAGESVIEASRLGAPADGLGAPADGLGAPADGLGGPADELGAPADGLGGAGVDAVPGPGDAVDGPALVHAATSANPAITARAVFISAPSPGFTAGWPAFPDRGEGPATRPR
jgi:hypothetical protein